MCFAAPVQSTAFPPATLSLLLQRKLWAWRLARTTSFVFCLIFFSLFLKKTQKPIKLFEITQLPVTCLLLVFSQLCGAFKPSATQDAC